MVKTLDSNTCICGCETSRQPFSEHFDVAVCPSCTTQRFIPKHGLPVREFSYNDRNEKYGDQVYLYSRELRWSHRQLLRFDWRGRRTLEIGCFNGFFVSALLRLGADAHGVDLNEAALHVGCEAFSLGGRLHKTLELAACQGLFDDVLCIDVMEHVEDPDSYLAHVSMLLRPGGRLVIAGPTVERRFFDKSDYPPHHKWRFSRSGLALFLDRGGFNLDVQLVQRDGMLFMRNFIGKLLNGIGKKEFYGDIAVASPSTEKGLINVVYQALSVVGTGVFTLLRIPYCSAVLVAEKRG